MEKLNLDKIEEDIKKFFNLNKDIELVIKKIDTVDNQIEFINESINKERLLKSFPSQAIGSVTLYNKLNEKYDLYVESQFNKIIRFLEHIENKENKYRELYVECTNDYIIKPTEIPLNELSQEKKEIDVSYALLTILVNEIDGDIVKFNKVYNKLEDAGLFMTVPEKTNQQYLVDISSKLDNVIDGLKVLFRSMEEANRTLREIEGNTSDISFNTESIMNDLWDLSSSRK